MATTSTNFISALGGGSGIDIKALAQSLIDTEKKPKEELINASIKKSEARISGYATVSYAVGQVQSALDALRNPSAFNSFSAASSKPTAVGVAATGSASTGTHEVEVQQLAQAQRSVSAGFTAGQSLNGGASYTVNLTVAGVVQTPIVVTSDTPEGLVAAINEADTGVRAALVNTGAAGSPLNVVLTGQSGAANAFSISSTSLTPLGFPASPQEAAQSTSPNRVAQDAVALIDGMTITRSTNQISDAVVGVTFNLLAQTAGTPAVITLARDTAPVKEKIKAVVDNYNDLQSILDAALDKDSTIEKLGGTLVGDTSIRALRDQMKRILLPDTAMIGGANAPLTNLRQLGLIIDTDGRMKFATLKDSASPGESLLSLGDEGRLDQALSQRFDEVVDLFAGATGLAKDMSDRVTGSGIYVDSTFSPSSPKKILNALSLNAGQRVTADKQRLVQLEDRMTQLLARYTKQFAVMESLVGESKSTRTGVENSFKGMSYSRS